MSCPYSRRGHRWRETPVVSLSGSPLELRDVSALPAPLRPRPDARFCELCGAAGVVNKQGTVKTIYEPPPCGVRVALHGKPMFVCGLQRGHGGDCKPPASPYRPLGWGVLIPKRSIGRLRVSHPCDRAPVRAAVLELAELLAERRELERGELDDCVRSLTDALTSGS